MLINTEPFGRRMHGSSKVLVTKDRPGQLRSHGKPTEHPGITYMGMLAIDDGITGPDFQMRFYAPKEGTTESAAAKDPIIELADALYAMVALLPEQQVESTGMLIAETRKAGIKARNTDIRAAADYPGRWPGERQPESRRSHGRGQSASRSAPRSFVDDPTPAALPCRAPARVRPNARRAPALFRPGVAILAGAAENARLRGPTVKYFSCREGVSPWAGRSRSRHCRLHRVIRCHTSNE
jgi:hypothetical protein